MTLHVRLLGPFACEENDGTEVAISGKKQRGVLAYLATVRGKSVSREQLAAMFWSWSGEEQARQSLRQCLASLRKSLGSRGHELIVSDGGRISLNPDQVRIDVDAVLQGTADVARDVRGTFLKDLVFGEDPIDDWIRDERVRLEAACRDALFQSADSYIDNDEHDRAIDAYWRLLNLSPACEEAHRALMKTYAHVGRRSEALAQYQACIDALRRHVDATPTSETTALFESLRHGGAEPAAASPRVETLPLPDKPCIAVLALDNLSGDPANEYLCDGFSEDITTFLSQFSSLYVVARNSAFAFKGTNTPIPEIGRQLGVHYVMEGSIQRSQDRIRVTAQLIEAEQGTHIWSQRYDGTMDDIFDLQDEIVQQIVATTVGRIEDAALRRARRKATSDLDAYELVLRGKWHHHQFTASDSSIAVQMFAQAVERKPDYALALGWYACAVGREKSFTADRSDRMNDEEYMLRVKRSIEAMKYGLTIDDEESECLRLIAEVALFRGQHDEAKRYIAKALHACPNDDRILSQMGAMATYWGDPVEGERYARLAMRLNPYHPPFYRLNLVRALVMQGRHEEALQQVRQISPTTNRYRTYEAACYAALQDMDKAARVTEDVLREDPGFSLEHFGKALSFEDAGLREQLLSLMEKAGLPR